MADADWEVTGSMSSNVTLTITWADPAACVAVACVAVAGRVVVNAGAHLAVGTACTVSMCVTVEA